MSPADFERLHRLYLPLGGLASGDEVAKLRQAKVERAVSTVARWIVTRRVISCVWESQILLPLFQFDLALVEPRPELEAVLHQLRPTYDDWALMRWFAEPHAALNGAAPAVLMPQRASEVLAAARAERLVAAD